VKKPNKIIITFVAFLLFIGTSGPCLHMHFCGNKLMSFSFIHTPKACCDSGCKSCKDVSAFYKIKDNFEKQAISISIPPFSNVLLHSAKITNKLLISDDICYIRIIHPPPLNRYSDLFTTVFRI
jgi:hypothetical protein